MGKTVGQIAKVPEVKQSNSNSRVRRTKRLQSMDSPVNRILYLQRTAGNQAVSKLMKSGALQAKLRIGQPGDVYEQEADRVADAVMRMPEPRVQRQVDEEEEEEILQTKPLVDQIRPLVQRQVEEEEEEEILHAKSREDATSEVNSNLESHINSFKGGGQPLSENDRAYFEPRFGRDFSQVRVHTDAKAAGAAHAVNARAFTRGHDVVFGTGQYASDSRRGNTLLAHELTHVVQQDGGGWTSARSVPVNKTDEQMIQGSFVGSIWKGIEKAAGAVWEVVKPFISAIGKGPKAAKPVKNPCKRTILAEGTCEFLALNSKWVCCDPKNGFKRPGKKTSIAEPNKKCPSEKWSPLFTCDTNCAKALKKGCADNDSWMAIPSRQFNRSKCGDVYTICANGKQTTGFVRDKSVTKTRYEVSPGIQKTLGVTVGQSFKGAIYRPGAKKGIIDKDPCCKS